MMNLDASFPEPDHDRELAALFAATALPPTPAGLAVRVQRRLRRRRKLQRAAVGLAATAMLSLGVLAWQRWPLPEPVVYEVPESAVLGEAPPVDKLDVLARQQAAYVTVLEQMAKEF